MKKQEAALMNEESLIKHTDHESLLLMRKNFELERLQKRVTADQEFLGTNDPPRSRAARYQRNQKSKSLSW